MKKILFILAFSNALTSELILEITQGTEDPVSYTHLTLPTNA